MFLRNAKWGMRSIGCAGVLAMLVAASPGHAQQGQSYGCAPGSGNYMTDVTGYGYGHWHAPHYRGPSMQEMQALEKMQSERPGRRMATLIDSNSDGVITEDEAAVRHETVFAAMDNDGSETVTREEFLAARMGRGAGYGPRHEKMQARKQDRFKKIDSDGNGELTGLEFMNAGKERFAASDLDRDGAVTVWEFRSQRRTWQ